MGCTGNMVMKDFLRQMCVPLENSAYFGDGDGFNSNPASVMTVGNHLKAISLKIPHPSITEIWLKVTDPEYCSNLPGVKELTCTFPYWDHGSLNGEVQVPCSEPAFEHMRLNIPYFMRFIEMIENFSKQDINLYCISVWRTLFACLLK